MMQSILISVLSLMCEEQILCTSSVPKILLHYCKHATLHGGTVSKSGTIFQVLPTFNETSLTSVNFEDRAHYCNMHSESFVVFPEHCYRILHGT